MITTALLFATLTVPYKNVSVVPRPRVTKSIQVGDCVTSRSNLKEYAEPIEDWEERKTLEYSVIVANGKIAYKIHRYYNGIRGFTHYVSKILYEDIQHYIKIECPK